MLSRISSALLVASSALSGAVVAAAEMDEPADFERAAGFSVEKLESRILNGDSDAHWIAGRDEFWLRIEDRSGHRFVIVDAASGEDRPAFNHRVLAASLQAAGGEGGDASALPITDLRFSGTELLVRTAGAAYQCDRDGSSCRPRQSNTISNGILSPDGRRAAFIENHNIWIRDVRSGDERALTSNGVDGFSHGYSDSFLYTPGGIVARSRGDRPRPIGGLIWSPDGRYIVSMRVDRRKLPYRLAVLEHLPPSGGSPVVHMDHRVVIEDSIDVLRTVEIINVETGSPVTADIPVENLQGRTTDHFASNNVYWDLESLEFYFQSGDRSNRRRFLYAVEMETGRSRVVVEESEKFAYHLNLQNGNRPNVFVGSEGNDLVWYSQRTGYGHLYLYDANSGELKHPITQGEWVVFDLLRVDESERIAYFTAGGRESGRDPYYAHLYRVSLDGGPPQLLTPENADHEFPNRLSASDPRRRRISPSGRYFIDVHSTVAEPPRMVVRRTSNGELMASVLEADASALYATGWRAPERFAVTAADGKTTLYGTMYKPIEIKPNRQYPVVEQVYPSPEGSAAPTSFIDGIRGNSGLLGRGMQQLAELGFVGITLDGRGSGKRSRSFGTAFLGTKDVTGVIDHKTAIEQLAKQHEFMDAQRVAVLGRSYGGYGALRAALLYPGFYDACVAVAGPHDFRQLIRYMRTWLGVPDESETKSRYYDMYSNLPLVDRLEAELLLIYGEIDENVPLVHAMEIFDALIAANKDFDMLVVPNQGHNPAGTGYGRQRLLRYLVEHLGRPYAVKENATGDMQE